MARKKSATKKAREAAAAQSGATLPNNEPKIQSKKELKSQPKQELEQSASESDTNDSSSEDEDEYGELLDQDTDKKINQVLTALKSNDKSLLDSKVRFFENPEEAVKKLEARRDTKEKPMYLKDYHRMNILAGGDVGDDVQNGNEDEHTKTFAETQREDRQQLLSEISNAFGGADDDNDEDDEDGFLKKKDSTSGSEQKNGSSTSTLQLPDPDKDQERFLQEFINKQAWIPNSKDSGQLDLGASDKDELKAEQEFDDAVENFEKVYNFRYEDATSSEIISYARNQATMRRAKMNSRKKQRLRKQEQAKEEKKKHQEKVNKKKQDKVNKVMDRLAEIKQAVGEEVDNEVIKNVFGDTLLNDDFDSSEWDAKMSEIFNEKYYEADEKPQWDDDDDIMKEFYDSKKNQKDQGEENSESEQESENEEQNEEESTESHSKKRVKEDDESEEPSKKKSKKEKLAEKKAAKRSKELLKKQAEDIVLSNMVKVEEEVEKEEESAAEKRGELKFKYREVEPESFGLTQKEILLADDKALNEYVSLKMLAPYRDPSLAKKDKRKIAKKRRLNEWRKKVFGNEKGLQD